MNNDIVLQQFILCSSQSSDVTSHVCGDVTARRSLNMNNIKKKNSDQPAHPIFLIAALIVFYLSFL